MARTSADKNDPRTSTKFHEQVFVFCPLAVPTEGVQWLETAPPTEADGHSLVLFDRGDEIVVQAGDDDVRFLLVSGQPLEEPVAWYGPIVMNTQEQLRQAFEELQEGTFLKHIK